MTFFLFPCFLHLFSFPDTRVFRNMAPFQIGLVLAGGATSGAYTAGVLDFLLEALQEWEKKKKTGIKSLPSWTVNVNNMTASSAGALVTMLCTVSLGSKHDPLPANFRYGDVPPKNNLLYKCWVSEFGPGIFSTEDLPPLDLQSNEIYPVKSFANSMFLRNMANRICLPVEPSKSVPAWAENMKIFLTVTNMNGIPYSSSISKSFNCEDKKYSMLKHSDCVGFNTSSEDDPATFSLNLTNTRNCADWQRLYDVAAASASVPFLFPSADLSRPLSHYENSLSSIPLLKPDWPQEQPRTYQHRFIASDGGIFNNEPIEICRNAMELSQQKSLESQKEDAWGACIIIDCISNSTVSQLKRSKNAGTLIDTASLLLQSMRNEAGFKDSDFFESMDEANLSQFLISPVREGRKNGESILATSTMGMFAGLLDEKIRHHDFALGRKNCQEFLRNHFTIDKSVTQANKIFSPENTEIDDSEESRTPIIPLYGSAAIDCVQPVWPAFTEEEKDGILQKFESQIFNRILAIITTYARNIGLLDPKSRWNMFIKGKIALVRVVLNIIAKVTLGYAAKYAKETLEQFS